MKRSPSLFTSMLFVLSLIAASVAVLAFAAAPVANAVTITYDFSTGLQGWTQVFPTAGDLWSADFGWPEGTGSLGHLGAGWNDSETQMGQSPEFTLDGSGNLTFTLHGSKSSLATVDVTPLTVPAIAIDLGGFCGVALRDVATNTYLMSKGLADHSYGVFTTLSFTAADMVAAGVVYNNRKYTLDWIDYDKDISSGNGDGWGWLVGASIPGALIPDPTWNGGAGTAGPKDGPGTWNTEPGNTIWFDIAPMAWTDGSPAVFGAGAGNGAAGDVAVAGTVKPTSITFNTTGDGGAYRLTQGIDGLIDLDGKVVKVTANVNAEIQTTIANGGLDKLGGGRLTLSGASTALTNTTVSAGTLTVNAGSITTLNVPAGRADLNSPATATTASVSGTGLLALGGTVGTLTVTGGTVNVGSGATAATADFSPGNGTVNASANALAITNTLNLPRGTTATYTPGGSATAFTVGGSNIVNDNQTGADARTVTLSGGTLSLIGSSLGGTASYTTANTYTFSPASNNLIANLSPSAVTNWAAGGEDTGPVTMLTDGAIIANNANTYYVGDNSIVTYTLPLGAASGYDLSKINIYSGWNDSGRENITLNNISFSTVGAPTTFTPITGSGVNYEGGTPIALASLEASGGSLAAGVYAIQFNFGGQENGAVGYRELEVVGAVSTGGAIIFPNTNIAVTASSVLDLPMDVGINKLGKLTVSGSTTVLTLSGATGASFNGLAGNGTVLGTVIIPDGGVVSPGASIGTITVSGLTLDAGSLLTFDIASTSSLDQVIVTDDGGLTINGGAFTLLEDGTSNAFADAGTYNLIGYDGAIGGDISNLAVVNTVQDRRYTFGAAGGFITLGIVETGFWNGGSSANVNWSDSANWNDIAPQPGDVLSFRTAGGLSTTLNNNLDNGRLYASLRFDVGAPAFTLDGNSIILNGEGGQKVIMVNNSTNIQTVSLDIALGTNGKIDANSGAIVVGGNISGDYSLTKVGSRQLTLSGDNSHTGGTIINAGNVVLGSPTALAGGNLTLGGGSLDLGGITHTVGAVSVTAAAGSGDTIGHGGLTADSYAVSNAADNVAISADLGGSGGLNKSGGGILTLTGANTYAGATSISSGTLQMNGSLTGAGGPVAVPTGGTLGVGASGNIARDVAVSGGDMNLAGKLAAGTTLTISGGTVNSTGTGGTAAIVTLPAQGATAVLNAPASQELTVTDMLTQAHGVTVTAGATPFKVAGSNVVNNIDALILQGGTTTIDQIVGNFGAGLEVRGWQGVDGQIDGSMFDMPGTPAHSTSAGTLGYATEAINMNGDNQEHFGADRHGGVPNASVRPPGYQDNYTVEYRGKLKIEADGIYSFATTSDDGSALWIDPGDVSTANPLYATAAVQNSYSQPMTTRNSGQISLTAGYHDFIVRFYEGGSGNGLQVQWDPTGGTTWAAIPGENYFHGSEGPGALNLPDTAVTVTDSSTLATPVGYGISKLGALTLVGGSELTLSGATSASFNGLAGTGSVVGTVIIPAGGMVSPGTDTTIGTITASGLTLDSGSFLTFNIAGTGSLDQVIVTDADGLTINGGGIFLFEAGGTTQFSTLGVAYSLIGYNTSFVGDLANLYVENKIPDTSYRFEANGSFITLTLAVAGYWNGGGTDPNWSTAANWNNIAPVTGDVLKFRAEGSAGVALNDNLDNGRSFASLQFDGGAPAFTLDGNSIKLTSDGGQRGIMVNNSANVQTVNMNVELTHNGKIDANSADIAVGGDISGGYSLTKIGGSQLTLSGDNSYTGGTIINAGNVVVGSATALGAAGGNLTMGGGSLNLGGTSQTIGVLSVTAAASGGDTISNGSLTGTSYNISNTTGEAVISANLLASGSAGLAKSGAGTATLSGTNTYTGLTDITAGTLKLGSAGALAGKGDVTVNGTLDLNDNSPTIKALNGAGTITTSAGAATLTVGDGDASGTFSGKITDGMSAVTVSTYELGASGSGTRIEVVNYPDNMGNLVPWIAKGTLPSGSILRSVSANLKIDASDADSWASDFLVYVDGAPEAPGTAALLQIGGDYNGAVGTVAQTLGWNGGDDGPPNGAVIDSKTSGNWSGDIDLSTAQLSIGNNYAGATFSGTVTVAYGGTAFPVSLTKVGNGTLELRGVIAYTGGTTIEAGTLYVHAADNAYHDGLPVPMGNVTIESGATLLGNRTNFVGTLTMNGGKWNDDNGFTGSWTGPVSLGAGTTSTIQGLQSINGDISGPGGLDVESPWWTPGELHLNGTNNTFEGGVTFRGGSIVTIVSSTGLGTGTLRTAASMYGPEEGRPWRINAGTLNVGADMSSGSGIANNIDLSSGGNFTVTGSDAVLSGQISGSGTLTKAGGNTLTLSAANIHTGGTIVNAGTLTINGSLADSTMTIDTGTANGNGTLTFNIVGATCDLIKVMNGGTLDITNLHIDINATAGDLTELSYVLVNWAIEAATAGNLIGAKFAGESVPYGWKIDYNLDDSQIVLVPGQVGDTNNDGVVDAADFITLKKNFGAGVGGGFTVGNFDNTGTVDWKDLRTLMTNMGNGGSGAPATTPEPATLGLLAIGGLALLRRRRAA